MSNQSGLSFSGGFHISTKALLVLLAGTVVGGYLGTKLIGTRPIQLAFTSKAYKSDIDTHKVKSRILTNITNKSKDPVLVQQRRDQLIARINAHQMGIDALINQRKIGEINGKEFGQRVSELSKRISYELGLPMSTGLQRVPDYYFKKT